MMKIASCIFLLMFALIGDPVLAWTLPPEATSWRKQGYYTWDMVEPLEKVVIEHKKELSPHVLGDFSQKMNLVLNKKGKLLSATIVSSNMPAEQDKLLLDYLRKHEFPPFPDWYKHKGKVTFPLELRQEQRMAEPTNGDKFSIITMGIYFIENPSGKSSASKTIFMDTGCEPTTASTQSSAREPAKQPKPTDESIKAEITRLCKRLGLQGQVKIKAYLGRLGFLSDFEVVEAKESSQEVIDLTNLTYKSRGAHPPINDQERDFEISISEKD